MVNSETERVEYSWLRLKQEEEPHIEPVDLKQFECPHPPHHSRIDAIVNNLHHLRPEVQR
jgi:hypothetical protein